MQNQKKASKVDNVVIEPGAVPLAMWRHILRDGPKVSFVEGTREIVDNCHAAVVKLIATGRAIYAVNTGFGKLAAIRIPDDQLVQLQRNLILSHSAGTGEFLSDDLVRLILIMKAAALAQGHSGVRWELTEALLALANAGVYPCLPAKGSVGASGDLAPLSHMAAALMGVGEVRYRGKVMAAADGLGHAGLKPMTLGPKEGVALINGTQVSAALGLSGLFAAEDVMRAALVTGALSLEACRGNDAPFDARIQAVRRHRGQQDVAAIYRKLLAGSPIREAYRAKLKVQDPYCMRCQPQVMGACLDNLRFAAKTLGIEANAVSDNPLVFPEEAEVLSGGNFHAEPVAFAADIIALAICEIGSLSERRQAMLIDATLSGLPAFLVDNSGLNSGFMIAQVTAAALTSENKMLAHPASVDSIPTSANQEDHVSMACHGAYRLGQMADNAAAIIALEWLSAAQGADFHKPLEPAAPLAEAVRRLRNEVPRLEQDRYFAPDIAAAKRLLVAGAIGDLAGDSLLDETIA
ncbi:histidine ammonia-lyase [Bradyrhizobium sp. Ash2021]|uniref:histidine ammonia-lyase n=1 Tax=Bradyrhizobium sp. Ash2021 TaxID=2954771 RepID=UPI0028161ACB|nr:histidine ammonia-lyase [Bradyrhizobium sp. Ash2021]WMT75961.1 histidine ammonia-lyase [Bradyrhizobium sp. Ash2021]